MKNKFVKYVAAVLMAVCMCAGTVQADNPALIQRSKDACKNATYDIPTVTNEIEGWPQGPAILCDAGVVMEQETGTVIYNKAMEEKRYPASTTKIMTALVALENSSLTDTVTFTAEGLKEAVPGNSYVTPVLQVGETLTMEQCLYAIMLVSGNEVSTQVAMQVGGSLDGFVALMNQKAEELGCKNTHFVNANGLHDENHYTTAYDLALIARAAYENEDFRKITGTKYYTIPATNMTSQPRELSNHHALLGEGGDWSYDGCLGGKTGYTDAALNTLVTYFEKEGTVYIAVVMHYKGTQIFTDTVMLAEYTKEFEKLQVIPEAYLLSEGVAIVPKGAQADEIDIEMQGDGTSDREEEILLFHSYQVGKAVVNEAARIQDEQAAREEEEKIQEEKNKEIAEQQRIQEKQEETLFYKCIMAVLGVLIILGILMILISVLVRRKKKRKNSKKRKAGK
ncbi:MAG: D-alanyl-D-alanine carboxypeptidase family protein [Blautia sp.]